MKITVKAWNDRETVFDFEPNTLISDIKQRFDESLGLPPQAANFLYQGQRLPIDKTFEECKIPDGALIHACIFIGMAG
jgi:hypothetical protein